MQPDAICKALESARRARGRWQAVEATLPALCRDAHAAGLSVLAIARALGVTRMHVHRLIHGRTDRKSTQSQPK